MNKVHKNEISFFFAFIAAMVFIACEEKAVKENEPEIDVPEVGIVFGVWSKLLVAYKLETGKAGDCKDIGYTPLGAEKPGNHGQSEYFSYECGVSEDGSIAFLNAESKNKIGNCPMKSAIKAQIDFKKGYGEVYASPSKACDIFEKKAASIGSFLKEMKWEDSETDKPKRAFWSYRESEDRMDGSKSYFASVTSTNAIYFSSPYDGGSSFDLIVRNMKKRNEVLLILSNGQFSGSSKTCRVKFDDSPVANYGYSRTKDYNSDVIFLNNAQKFIANLKKAEKLMIECEFFQKGREVIEFNNVQGLEWNRCFFLYSLHGFHSI